MEKIKKIFNKIKIYYKRKRLIRQADAMGSVMCSSCFRLFPPSFYVLNDRETIQRESQKAIEDLKKVIEELERKSVEEEQAKKHIHTVK